MNSSNLEITTSAVCPLLPRAIGLVAIAVACVTLLPRVHAVTPPPDGGYPNQNTAEGSDALFSVTTGGGNTASGFDALFHNTTGGNNTATGYAALLSNTTGFDNVATGFVALGSNTTAIDNTATGYAALLSNTTGNNNTATGADALSYNTTGFDNTATGLNALFYNTTGFENTANGVQSLYSNTNGNYNTANGDNALFDNTTGGNNTANGAYALYYNTIGDNGTANGYFALYYNTTGDNNTANGYFTLLSNTTGSNNTANGYLALSNNTTGGSNIALGESAGINLTRGSNNIDIGNKGKAGESNYIRIGTKGTHTHTLIAGISGATVARGVGVIIDSNGHLGTVVSSERFKDKVKPMDKASEAILALKPVTFRYKHEVDPDGIPQFGLVAEQVEKVDPDLVVRDDQGKAFTVRYEAVNAMLLNEFLKEHRKVQELEATVAEQKKEMQVFIRRVEEQAAAIQKISTKIDLNKAGSRTIASN